MKIAQKFILLISLLFATSLITASITSAQGIRPTSFDNRPICEESKGNWREFGNGCGDDCTSKFDKYQVCTRALTYACDCGKGRCWHDNKCLTIESYKKIFDEENAEKEKILEARRKEREERIKNDPNLSNYLQNIYVKKEAQQAGQQGQPGQAAVAGQNQGIITQAAPVQEIASQPAMITQVPNAGAATPPTATSQTIAPPPFFLQQEKSRLVNAEANSKGTNTGSAAPPLENGGIQPPQLPIIPLP